MIDKLDTEKIQLTINNANNIVIIPHINPDGDAMGSSLGLFHVLKNRGKKAKVLLPSGCPNYLKWMNGSNSAIDFDVDYHKVVYEIEKADLLIFVDFNSLKRTGYVGTLIEKSNATKIMIDHHPYPDNIADIMISQIQASSTCELAYNLVKLLAWDEFVNTAAAECFYTGIITDTGALSYNSSNPETYITVANLLTKGVNKDKVHNNIFHNNSYERMKLLGHVLANKLVLMPEQGAAYTWITKEELSSFGFQKGDTEGFVNYPLSIAGINISAFFMEIDDKIKCSFRSQGTFPVNLFSGENFSGGGHRNAAGGESYLSMQQTIEEFKSALPPFYNKFINNEL